jgi:hypothetical protein
MLAALFKNVYFRISLRPSSFPDSKTQGKPDRVKSQLIDSSTKAERVLHSEQPEKTDSAENPVPALFAELQC